MTRSALATTIRAVVPAPRPSPENGPESAPERRSARSPAPDDATGFPPYPLVRYALDHATALRPRQG